MKTYEKKLMYLILLTIAILAIACSLQMSFATTDFEINDKLDEGILYGISQTGDGKTLTLKSGTYNKSGQDVGISIDKSITIQGNGSPDSVVIDAHGHSSRIFSIGADDLNVKFVNLTFKNANFNGNGGAVINPYANTVMTFINCSFINNQVTGSGGAIHNSGNKMNLSNCKFEDNKASFGGAVFNNRNFDMYVEESNFADNIADYGGAIYNYFANNVIIVNSNFESNKAIVYDGGAIYNQDSDNLSISYCNFINNFASIIGYGGAVFNNAKGMIISNSNFTYNIAEHGAGIYNSGLNLNIKNSNFTNNRGSIDSGHGGAIYNSGSNMDVSSSNFNENSAKHGGAIFNEHNDESIVSNSNFTNNHAAKNGGAIFNSGTKTSISISSFKNNHAEMGGALYNNHEASNSIISDSKFINNFDDYDLNGIINFATDFTIINPIFDEEETNGDVGNLNPNNVTPDSNTGVNKITTTETNKGANTATNTDIKTAAKTATPPAPKKADLKITQITKKGSSYYVVVKNIGKAAAGKNTLGVYVGKKLIKTVSVKSIGIGKNLKVKVVIPKKYLKLVKTFKVDIKNVVKESNKNNNSFKYK